MTARRRRKKPRRKPPGKRDQSVPRSQISEAEETDERDVLETPKQLEERLASVDREATRMASRIVDTALGQTAAKKGGDDTLHIRLRKRKPPDIARAMRQFADPFFEHLFSDAKSASCEFARKIEQSDAIRDLIGCDQLSLRRVEILMRETAERASPLDVAG